MRQVSNYHRGVDDHRGETENNRGRVGRDADKFFSRGVLNRCGRESQQWRCKPVRSRETATTL